LLLQATNSGNADVEAYEMDLKRGHQEPRRLVTNARRLEFGETDNARLLVTVADVTDARVAEKLKDDLLREKAILLQEIQHRVANASRSSPACCYRARAGCSRTKRGTTCTLHTTG
jgi:hypothetical protein